MRSRANGVAVAVGGHGSILVAVVMPIIFSFALQDQRLAESCR